MASESVENEGPQLKALAIAFIALTWIGVLLRAYTRAVIVKQITWDDKFIAASLVGPRLPSFTYLSYKRWADLLLQGLLYPILLVRPRGCPLWDWTA